MSEKFWISTVKSRMDKKIEGHEFTWEEFVSKFENPVRTSETLLEYASMDSDARANAKDVGGIIPGHFLGDNRKEAQVEDIRLLKLDVDEIPSYLDFVSCVESVLQGYSFFVHSTHSHTTTDTDIVTPDELNTDEDLINFKNGMLRISDLKLLPHSPKYLSTIQIDAEWSNENIETPNTDYYLNNLTDYDDALIQLLYQFIGVVLSNIPGRRMKKALFLVGPGDTGKSLLKVWWRRY